MIKPLHTAFAALTFATAACATIRGAGGEECVRPPSGIEVTPQHLEAAPGETVQLAVLGRFYGATPIPEGCPRRWRVSGPARIDAAGRLTVNANAVPGDTFTVEVVAMQDTTWDRGVVVSAAANPVAGAWSQVDNGCLGPRGRIGELIFWRNGEFRMTEELFETVTGPRGSYTYDTATKQLSLSIQGAPVGAGRAYIENDQLVIEGIDYFTVPQPPAPGETPPPPCRAIFARRPMPHV